MKIAKNVTAAFAAAALAASMGCALPAMASAAPAAASTEATTTYTAMATSTTKATVKANEKRPLYFKLNGKKIKSAKVAWKSKNAKIATVSKKGIVTTKKEGKVTVTGKYQGHTIYYKLTVKGDAARDNFNAVVSSAKAELMANEPITENGQTIYRYEETKQVTEGSTTFSIDYNATTKQFVASINAINTDVNVSYDIKLSFSEKYADKNCTITSYKNGEAIKSITKKKSSLKSSNFPKLSDNFGDELVLKLLEQAVSESINSNSKAVDMLHYLGFTSIEK